MSGSLVPEPLVSIITPAYNAERFIQTAIDSVINQTWKNWELIIINDGSTDRTENICHHYTNQDPRIKLINSSNKGVSHARNLGLKSASGKYIGFLDSDDYLATSYISLLVNSIHSNQADLAGAGVINFEENSHKIVSRHHSNYQGYFLKPLVNYDPGVFLAVFYIAKSESIKNVYFEEEITNGEDFLFWLTCCSKRKLKYQGVEEDGYFYRLTSNSASKNLDAWAKSQKFILSRCWSLNIKTTYKLTLSYKIMRQLASYHIKKTIGIKIRV